MTSEPTRFRNRAIPASAHWKDDPPHDVDEFCDDCIVPFTEMQEARAILANPAAAEPHQHDPTHHAGDTNAFCSKCGYFPLPLKDARRFGSEPPAEPRWPSGPAAALVSAAKAVIDTFYGVESWYYGHEMAALRDALAALQEKRDPGE